MQIYEYTLDFKPIPLQRARHYKNATIDPSKPDKVAFYWKMKETYKSIPCVSSMCIVSMHFHFQFPKAFSKKKKKLLIGHPCTNHIDVDNCIKFFLDAGNDLLWKDDRIIYGINAFKWWSEKHSVSIKIIESDFQKNHIPYIDIFK